MTGFVADIPKVEVSIVELTNTFRRENGLSNLKRDTKLDAAARQFGEFLARSGLFGHEADGRRPVDRIAAAGYPACAAAENLASFERSNGFETQELARAMVQGWKNSPGHRKNMLMGLATETGVAVIKVKNAEKYVSVQLFGRPQSLQFQFKIDNRSGQAVSYELGQERHTIGVREVVTHTTCAPQEISFATGAKATSVDGGRQTTAPGLLLRLVPGRDGAIEVVKAKQD